MKTGTELLAEKTALLWFAVVSKSVLDAVRDPESPPGKELLKHGIHAETLQEVSAIVRARGSSSLEELHNLFRDSFCSPPPCAVAQEHIGKVVGTLSKLL